MNKREAYIKLDNKLNYIMREFWEKYPGIGVSMTGSVLHGEWKVMRSSQFDGIKFKLTDKQMNDLIGNGEVLVKEDDIIDQKEYEEENDRSTELL